MKFARRWAAGVLAVGLVALAVSLTSRNPCGFDRGAAKDSVPVEQSEDSVRPSARADAISIGERDPVGNHVAADLSSDAESTDVEREWRSIFGVVRSRDGWPIPDAQIQSLTTGNWRKAHTSEDILETHRRSPASSVLRVDRSGQDGSFSILNPLPGYVKLQIVAPDFVSMQSVVHVPDSECAVDAGVLTLEHGVRLSGIVVDADGNGVPGVEFRPPITEDQELDWGSKNIVTRLMARTTAAGAFLTDAIAPGAWSFKLLSAGHPELTVSGDTSIDPSQDLRFTLPVGLEIGGRVLADEGYGLEGLLVQMELSKSQNNLVSGIRGFKRSAACSADGSFTLRSIPAELKDQSLSLIVRRAKGDSDELVSAVAATPGEQNVRIELASPFYVHFGVRNATTGEVLPAPELRIDYWTDGVFRGESHRYSMPQVREDDGAKGRYRIRLTSDHEFVYRLHLSPTGFPSYHSIPVRPVAGEALDLGWLEFSPRIIDSVRVTDQISGLPIEGAVVYMIDKQGLNNGPNTPRNFVNGDKGSYYTPAWGTGKADADGRVFLARDVDTEYYLLATHPSYATREVELISANEPQLIRTINLSHGATLRVHVTGRMGGELTTLKSVCEHTSPTYKILARIGPPPATWAGQDGVAVIEHLAIGQHRFLVRELQQFMIELDVVDSGIYERRIHL